jgi:hypothetical protein
MKPALFTMAFFVLMASLQSQVVADGYLVTLANDTVGTQLKLPAVFGKINWEKIQHKIRCIDTVSAVPAKYSAGSIKGYGFETAGNRCYFTSMGGIISRPVFCRQIVAGNRAALYYYFKSGYRGSITKYFAVERQDNSLLVVKGPIRKKTIQRLSDFFAADTAAQIIIQNFTFSRKHPISALISALNSQ